MTHQDEPICDRCGEPIPADDKKAYGPRNAVSHFRCFKLGTAHGREVTLERCPNCGCTLKPKGGTCFQCGVGPRIGGER